MIIDAILNGISSFVIFFINLFPVISLPSGLADALQGLSEIFTAVSFYLPISTFVICVGLVLAFYSTRFFISLLNWLVSKIPAIN